jgi:hypothetical protein
MMDSPVSDTSDSTMADEEMFENELSGNEKDIEKENFGKPWEKATSDRPPSKRANTTRSRSRPRSLNLQLSRSIPQSHGCSCCDNNEKANDPIDSAAASEKAFEVQFEGDDDAMSPRNLPTLRRWVIVIIVCLSSTCV